MNAFLREDVRLVWLALKNPATWLFALAGGLWAWAYTAGNLQVFWPLAVLAVLLTVVAMADAETQLLPLAPVLAVAFLGLGLNPFTTLWWGPLAGLLLAGGGVLGVGMLTHALTGKAALGGGDVYLAAALGAWLTPIGLLPWLSAVAVLGLLVLFSRKILGQEGRFAFAPILCAAAWLALLHGQFYYAVVLP
jgi:leader peptidase (prepilin peptidase)/N-methyltransferase